MQLTNELDIHCEVDECRVVITSLYDAKGEETMDPERAVVAVGQYLTGPNAGWWFTLPDPRQVQEVAAFRLH